MMLVRCLPRLEASPRRGGLVRRLSRLAVLNQGQNCPPEDIWQCPETCLIVTVGDRVLLACGGQRPGILPNVLQCTWQSPQRVIHGKVSIVGQVSRDPGLYQAPTVTSYGPGKIQGPFFLKPTPPSLPPFAFMNDIAHGPAKVLCAQYVPDVMPSSPPRRRVSQHLGDPRGSCGCSEQSREKHGELDLSD